MKYSYYVEFLGPDFRIWKCEDIDEKTSKLLEIINTYGDFNIKKECENRPNDIVKTDIVKFTSYSAALDGAECASNKIIQQRIMEQHEMAQYHLRMFLSLSNFSESDKKIRDLYNNTYDVKWSSSWQTPVYRYCYIGNKEKCLISIGLESLDNAEINGNEIIWDKFGEKHYFYKTKELALEKFLTLEK